MLFYGILELDLFDVWGINLRGPFVPSNSNLYILIAVDYVSKWVGHRHSQPMTPSLLLSF